LKRFNKDRKGALELPFRLIISMIMVALTVTIVAQGLYRYSENTVENDIKVELEKLERTITLCKQGGLETALTVELKFSRSFTVRLAELQIGDEIGGETSSLIKYSLSTGRTKTMAVKPSVMMSHVTFNDDGTIESSKKCIVSGSTMTLQLKHIESEGEIIIHVQKID